MPPKQHSFSPPKAAAGNAAVAGVSPQRQHQIPSQYFIANEVRESIMQGIDLIQRFENQQKQKRSGAKPDERIVWHSEGPSPQASVNTSTDSIVVRNKSRIAGAATSPHKADAAQSAAATATATAAETTSAAPNNKHRNNALNTHIDLQSMLASVEHNSIRAMEDARRQRTLQRSSVVASLALPSSSSAAGQHNLSSRPARISTRSFNSVEKDQVDIEVDDGDVSTAGGFVVEKIREQPPPPPRRRRSTVTIAQKDSTNSNGNNSNSQIDAVMVPRLGILDFLPSEQGEGGAANGGGADEGSTSRRELSARQKQYEAQLLKQYSEKLESDRKSARAREADDRRRRARRLKFEREERTQKREAAGASAAVLTPRTDGLFAIHERNMTDEEIQQEVNMIREAEHAKQRQQQLDVLMPPFTNMPRLDPQDAQRQRMENSLIRQLKHMQEIEDKAKKVREIQQAKEQARLQCFKHKQERASGPKSSKAEEERLQHEMTLQQARRQRELERLNKRIEEMKARHRDKLQQQSNLVEFACKSNMISNQLMQKEIARRREEQEQQIRRQVQARKTEQEQRKGQLEQMREFELNRKRAIATISKSYTKKLIEDKQRKVEEENRVAKAKILSDEPVGDGFGGQHKRNTRRPMSIMETYAVDLNETFGAVPKAQAPEVFIERRTSPTRQQQQQHHRVSMIDEQHFRSSNGTESEMIIQPMKPIPRSKSRERVSGATSPALQPQYQLEQTSQQQSRQQGQPTIDIQLVQSSSSPSSIRRTSQSHVFGRDSAEQDDEQMTPVTAQMVASARASVDLLSRASSNSEMAG